VTADGTVEVEASDSKAVDLGAEEVGVRNLDLDLAEQIPALDKSAIAKELAITAPTQPALGNRAGKTGEASKSAAPLEPLKRDAAGTRSQAASAEIAAKLVLEVKGPAEQVEALLKAIRNKRIQLPPIELLVRDI